MEDNPASDASLVITKAQDVYRKWAGCGGGSNWVESMGVMYKEAQQDGKLEAFMNDLLTWHAEGKVIMARLYDGASMPFPRIDWEARNLLRQTLDLAASVQDGISVMETMLVYHKLGLCFIFGGFNRA